MTDATNSLSLSQFYPQNLLIESVLVEDKEIHIKMRSHTKRCNCPKCIVESSSLHATHHRKVQDLPIYGKRVMLDVNLYEFNCVNPECSITSFTETFENFLNNYSYMTERLVALMTTLALETSCESCARILKSMNIKTSGDTVIRTLIKRYEKQSEAECGSAIGIDDFAYKKRHTYGTIIVDEETHKPVAILDGRDGVTLKEWLKMNKQVKTVTRDRASAYAKAVEEILPDCMQIADRFHLHQNLMDAVNKILSREIASTTAITSKETIKENLPERSEGVPCKKNRTHCG